MEESHESHESTRCIKCMYMVVDPICTQCYLKEFVIWMNDQKIPFEKRAKVLKKINKNLMKEGRGELCVLCGKNYTSLCHYCFFYNAKTILKTEAPKEMGEKKATNTENYVLTFNYQMDAYITEVRSDQSLPGNKFLTAQRKIRKIEEDLK